MGGEAESLIGQGPVDNPVENAQQHAVDLDITMRSLIVGGLCGSLIAASNIYLSFKTGWTFGAGMFSAILGFAIVKPMQSFHSRYVGGYFGPKENCALQAAGVASGSLSAGYSNAIPALGMLGNRYPIGTLYIWSLVAAYYGLFYAVPLRKYAIIKQKLKFPSALATAHLIRLMHSAADSAATPQIKLMLICFVGAILWMVITHFVPFLFTLHVLYWCSRGGSITWLRNADLLGWNIQITPAFFSSGILMGLNPALSFLVGSIVAWAIVGPILLATGTSSFESESYSTRPQFWLLWPGIGFMLVGSLTELALNWRIIWNSLKSSFLELRVHMNSFCTKFMNRGTYAVHEDKISKDETADATADGEDELDPVPQSQQVPVAWWTTGLVVSCACTILVLQIFFNTSWYLVILALLCSFLFALIGAQSCGETDVNPVGAIGKLSQFLFAGVSPGQAEINLIAGNVAAVCAGQSVDMLQDLRTAHELGAAPRAMFIAQMVGSLFGVIVATPVFWLFQSAYPCIYDVSPKSCPFPMPAAKSWYAVTDLLTKGFGAMPNGAAPATGFAALLAILVPISKRFAPERAKRFIPSIVSFGLAFVVTQPALGLAMAAGAIFAKYWSEKRPASFEQYNYGLVSGLAAGEGIGGVFQAILIIGGVNQHISFGMPSDE